MTLRRLSSVYRMAALLCLLSLLGCATTHPVQKSSLPGVDNFSLIEAGDTFAGSPVGFGGATSPEALQALSSAGFATVISLRQADEEGMELERSRQAAETLGIRYLSLPLNPGTANAATLTEILDAMEESGNQPLYLHCGSGTRAAAVWMIGRVQRDGLSQESAEAEARVIAGKPERAVILARKFLESR